MPEFIYLAKDFTTTPGGRYRAAGPFSAEEFREDILKPAYLKAMSEGSFVRVNLDGTAGLAHSFLEEAFGGLVRSLRRDNVDFRGEGLQLVSMEEPEILADVLAYINAAYTLRRI